MAKTPNHSDALVPSWQADYPEQAFENAFVVGLAGYIGAGKTTIGEAVLEQINQAGNPLIGRKMSFAGRLKETLAAFTNQPGCSYSEPAEKQARIYGSSEMTVRQWLVEYATTFVRDGIGEDFWLDVIATELSRLKRPTLVVIDDYRFPNESSLIGAIGVGIFIKRAGVEQTIKHRSEQPEALGIKHVVDNNSTVEAAAQVVIKIVEANQRYQQLKARAKSQESA